MPEWMQYAAPILTAIAGLMAGRLKNRNSLIDQLQQERKELSQQLKDVNARVDVLYADKFSSRLYVASLIEWGLTGGGPPVPDAPEGYVF